MGNLIKRTSSVQEVGVVDVDVKITSVTQFTRITNSRTAGNNLELVSAEFEQNSLERNSQFLVQNDDNPLVYGLQNLDRMAMAISGKSATGLVQFIEQTKYLYSTASYMKSTGLAEATDIVLRNLGMFDPVKSGLPRGLRYATAFNTLSLTMAKDIQRGIRVFTIYNDEVYAVGRTALVEWSNNG